MTTTQSALLSTDHQMMKAWDEFCDTDEFKNALRWAVETKYDDGRPIDDIQREQHAKGSMWLAFTKGMECREGNPQMKLSIFAILILLSQPIFASGYHKPPPTPPPPEVIKENTVIQEDTNKTKYVVLGAVVIAGIVCWYNECWKEKPTFTVKSIPGDDR
jgi:hypothetical protein